MKKKNSSIGSTIKNLIILVVIGVGIWLVYTNFIAGGNSGFNIESGNAFGTPSRSQPKEVDNEGHTEDFWTNNKFKW